MRGDPPTQSVIATLDVGVLILGVLVGGQHALCEVVVLFVDLEDAEDDEDGEVVGEDGFGHQHGHTELVVLGRQVASGDTVLVVGHEVVPEEDPIDEEPHEGACDQYGILVDHGLHFLLVDKVVQFLVPLGEEPADDQHSSDHNGLQYEQEHHDECHLGQQVFFVVLGGQYGKRDDEQQDEGSEVGVKPEQRADAFFEFELVFVGFGVGVLHVLELLEHVDDIGDPK